MINLINTLFFRIKKTRTFWIMLALCVGLPLFGGVVSYVILQIAAGLLGEMAGTLVDILANMGTMVNVGSDFCVMAVIAIAIIIGGEFSNGTIRNSVLSNKSRVEIYGAYCIVSTILSLILATVYFVVSFGVLAMFFGTGGYTASEIAVSLLTTWGLCLLVSILATMVTVFFVVATKKVSMGIVLPILVCLVLPSIISAFFTLSVALGTMDLQALAWVPFVQYSVYDGSMIDGAVVAKIAIVTTALAAVFGGFGLLILQKSDLK